MSLGSVLGVGAILLAALTLSCGSCQEPAETSAPPSVTSPKRPPPASIDPETGSYKMEVPIGDRKELAGIFEAELPPDYPSDLPLYPDSRQSAAMSVPGAGMMVTFSSEDSSDEVRDFFRDQLVDQGWTIEDDVDLGVEHRITVTKGGRRAAISISGAADETQIGVMIDPERG